MRALLLTWRRCYNVAQTDPIKKKLQTAHLQEASSCLGGARLQSNST